MDFYFFQNFITGSLSNPHGTTFLEEFSESSGMKSAVRKGDGLGICGKVCHSAILLKNGGKREKFKTVFISFFKNILQEVFSEAGTCKITFSGVY